MTITIETKKGIKRFDSRRVKSWVRVFAMMLTATGAASMVAYGINYGATTQTGVHPALYLVPIYTAVTLGTGWTIRKWAEEARREMIKTRRRAKAEREARKQQCAERRA